MSIALACCIRHWLSLNERERQLSDDRISLALRFASSKAASFNSATQWTRLRSIGNSSASRLVILIPVVGYWIIFNDWLVVHTVLVFDKTGDVGHVPMRLFITYFGLCLIGLASGIYGWACPPEIKQSATVTEYVTQTYPHATGLEVKRMEDAVRNGDAISLRLAQELTWRMPTAGVVRTSQDEIEKRRDFERREWVGLYFGLRDRSRRAVRCSIAICYALGSMALAIPALDIFLRVAAKLVTEFVR